MPRNNEQIKAELQRLELHVNRMNTRVRVGSTILSVEPIQIALQGILEVLGDIQAEISERPQPSGPKDMESGKHAAILGNEA